MAKIHSANFSESLKEISPIPLSVFAPGLYSLSQKPIPIQLPSAVSLPSTRASRGVRLNSKAQPELESQERVDAGRKLVNAERKNRRNKGVWVGRKNYFV